jgi:hypothetical protein
VRDWAGAELTFGESHGQGEAEELGLGLTLPPNHCVTL